MIQNEYREHNRVLEQSSDFQKILLEVEKEVYTQFTLDGIRDMELYLANGGEDEESVYEAFVKLASKKESVSTKELDAIIATAAMQVPAKYELEDFDSRIPVA
jgi:hypothetical protein